MNHFKVTADPEAQFPILILPKNCTYLETNCEASDNVFIDLKITSPDTEGNTTIIYSGFCNIKLIDSYDVNIMYMNNNAAEEYQGIDDSTPVVLADPPIPYETQSQVWIDPSRSPFVYNHYDMTGSQGYYSVCHQSETSITVQQQNSLNVTKSVYNFKEAVHFSAHDKKALQGQMNPQFTNHNESFYKDDELECGVFLSKLPEEILNQKLNKAREDSKFIGIETENLALKQLMAPDIQTLSKQRKTILYLGPDAHCGQTIQQIAYEDPNLQCSRVPEVDNEVVIDEINPPPNSPKRYQCAKCHQIFDQISEFREHMIKHDKPVLEAVCSRRATRKQVFCDLESGDTVYMCPECGKNLKSKKKFEQHCLNHGNPDRECPKCHKVYVSKMSLRLHMKIHERKYPCRYCTRTYGKEEDMRAHASKVHAIYMCQDCDFVANKHSELLNHEMTHNPSYGNTDSSETEFADSYFDDVLTTDSDVLLSDSDVLLSDSDVLLSDSDALMSSDPSSWELEQDEANDIILMNSEKSEDIKNANSVIAKVMSNKMFLSNPGAYNKRYLKICDVCEKTFDRLSDLKRHLIEHIIHSSLAKATVTGAGALNMQCEVCHTETFSKINEYKAHLREHANLTLYKCTLCNKTFSDSSNFCKHKKTHGAPFFQCDLCHRKFNSKKMMAKHIEYHKSNKPLNCTYCDRVFHFESMLNKHIKICHTKEFSTRYKCKLCVKSFKSLKEKWDHEWNVHSVRKIIVDCLLCGTKFRKYSQLKRHCSTVHNLEVPTAKRLRKKQVRSVKYSKL